MRIVLEEKSWKRVISKLKDRDIQMFMVLSLLVGNNEKAALPLPEIRDVSGVCMITVRRALHHLCELGLIKVEAQEFGPNARFIFSLNKKFVTFED